MSAWVAGIIGFVVGWVVEWLIDLVYWRRRAEESVVPSPVTPDEKDQIIRDLRARLDERDGTINRLEAALAAKEEEIRALSARVEQSVVAPTKDDLTRIKGIGPTYQAALQRAGVTSFAQLAGLSPERIRQILGVPQWRKIEPEAWIEQAARLSGQA
jgi:predicted flap endonuclease-1-like 5' DNA nuclease